MNLPIILDSRIRHFDFETANGLLNYLSFYRTSSPWVTAEQSREVLTFTSNVCLEVSRKIIAIKLEGILIKILMVN